MARRGISVTSRCEFGFGKGGFTRIASGTVSVAMRWLKLPCERACRPQRKRTRCGTERSQMGRPRQPSMSEGCYDTMRNPHLGIASPVLQRRHAGKATEGNSGDQTSSKALALVTAPISASEGAGEVVSGVGEGSSIREDGDSITPSERRALT